MHPGFTRRSSWKARTVRRPPRPTRSSPTAGGVTVSYFEWVQDLQSLFWSEEEINQRLERIMVQAFRGVVQLARDQDVLWRTAALIYAVKRVADALLTRGIYP